MTFYFYGLDGSGMYTFGESPMIALLWHQVSFIKLVIFSPCRLPLQVHRMLMLATSVLTCTAFVLPFVYRGGWSRVSVPATGCLPGNLFWCQSRLLLYSQRWIMRHFCVHPFFLDLSDDFTWWGDQEWREAVNTDCLVLKCVFRPYLISCFPLVSVFSL